MDSTLALLEALNTLGDLLEARGETHDLVIVGGGALLLMGAIERPTLDVDVLARVVQGLASARPLPAGLVAAVRDVGRALDLPHQPRDEKDWLNSGPTFLLEQGLPKGFQQRLNTRRFSALTLRIPSRRDLITFELYAATDVQRGARRADDIADLRALAPTREELSSAVAWCRDRDGRPDFLQMDAAPVLAELGWPWEAFEDV